MKDSIIPSKQARNLLLILIGLPFSIVASSFATENPKVRLISHSQESIDASVARYKAKDPITVKTVEAIRSVVEREYIDLTPPSVVNKSILPASGDLHDYMSMSPYWWPDPDKEDGLPYIRIDGKVNPLRYKLDNVSMDKMVQCTWYCSVLYTYTGEEKYAQKAADFLRVWFLNKDTRMNPNLKYSQSRPGHFNLRASALLDSQRMLRMIDSSPLLLKSNSWTIDNHKALQTWFADFTDWYHTSEQGIGQNQATNNHGSYYDTQLICFAAFAGKDALALKTLQEMNVSRIAPQLENDGSQPEELARTRPFHYTTFNLTAWIVAAQIGDQLGVNVWAQDSGKNIGLALKWLEPYATSEIAWEKPKPIKKQDKIVYRYLIQISADNYTSLDKETILAKLPDFDYKTSRQLRYLIECEFKR